MTRTHGSTLDAWPARTHGPESSCARLGARRTRPAISAAVSIGVRPCMQSFVVVSGLPASGKSTLAKELAAQLQVAHFDKDDFLERLFCSRRSITPSERSALSRQADLKFQEQAILQACGVLSSWWRHPNSTATSGTPIAWLLSPETAVIEVHCDCSVQVALERFKARTRHAAHCDAQREPEALLKQFEEAHALGPLFPAHALMCNTSNHVSAPNLAALVAQLRCRTVVASKAS